MCKNNHNKRKRQQTFSTLHKMPTPKTMQLNFCQFVQNWIIKKTCSHVQLNSPGSGVAEADPFEPWAPWKVFLWPWWWGSGPWSGSSQCHNQSCPWSHEQCPIAGSHYHQRKARQNCTYVLPQEHETPVFECVWVCVCVCVYVCVCVHYLVCRRSYVREQEDVYLLFTVVELEED